MKKDIAIFDMDGVLADFSHRYHYLEETPKNWDMFLNPNLVIKDPPIEEMLELYRLWHYKYTTVILTGRSEALRDASRKWLADNACCPDRLIMRPLDDFRPGPEFKVATIKDLIDIERVAFFIDDNLKIVEAVGELGITTILAKASCLQDSDLEKEYA